MLILKLIINCLVSLGKSSTNIKFMDIYKYQGTGNDFIIIDNRNLKFIKDSDLISNICNRRFGVGGDGLILLEDDEEYDFRMIYYNSDGNEGSMCGNGGRCIVSFAHFLGIFVNKTIFNAVDGIHQAEVHGEMVRLKMIDVEKIDDFSQNSSQYTLLDTGSPHYVKFVEDLDDLKNMNVREEGKKIRYSKIFFNEGVNVNFVSKVSDNQIFVRTYERGVEDETFSCGTGATAAALTFMQNNNQTNVRVKVLGGELIVYAEKCEKGFRNVWLEGPAKQVFKANFNLM